MKISKFFMLASASVGILALTACGEDKEEADSRFWVADRDNTIDSKGGNGNGADLSSFNGGDENTPGGYGDFQAEDMDYVQGFGKRITNAPDFAPVYFKFDTFAMPADEGGKVDAIAKFLSSNPGTGVVIEGNCDERGTQEYNRALGERRAISVKTALLDRGIAENRIATQSYGEDKPAVTGSNETAWSRNRRADFVPVLLNNR